MDNNAVDVSDICISLATMATECTIVEAVSRLTALLQLHQHWKLGHSVKTVCITCGTTNDCANPDETVHVTIIDSSDPDNAGDTTDVLQPDAQHMLLSKDYVEENSEENVPEDKSSIKCSSISRSRLVEENEVDLNKCIICCKGSDNVEDSLTMVKAKGIRTITRCCIGHQHDALKRYLLSSPPYVLVHEKCRKNFTSIRKLHKINKLKQSRTAAAAATEGAPLFDVPTPAAADYDMSRCVVCQEDTDDILDALVSARRRLFLKSCIAQGNTTLIRRMGYPGVVRVHDSCRVQLVNHNRPAVVALEGSRLEAPGLDSASCDAAPESRVAALSQPDIHMRADETLSKFSCEWCSSTFNKLVSLKLHIKTSHPDERPFVCCECQQGFAVRKQLLVHLRQHSSRMPFTCAVCDVGYRYPSALKKHLASHLNERRHRCGVCQRGFNQLSNLRDHERLHSGDRPFQCQYCRRSFAQSQNLRKHIQLHVNDKPFKCDLCSASFRSQSYLKMHRLYHTGTRQHECPACGKAYFLPSHLKQHMRTHVGDKRHRCWSCGEKFYSAVSLRRHMRLQGHLTPEMIEQIIVCDECGMLFDTPGTLKTHMTIHSGEKPFQCSQCDMKFRLVKNLNSHMKKHSSDKPFLCSKCGRAFKAMSDMKKHAATRCSKIMLHRDEDATTDKTHVQCHKCGKVYTSLTRLSKHLKCHTAENNETKWSCADEMEVEQHCRFTGHLSVKSDDGRFVCKRGQVFDSLEDLQLHSVDHDIGQPLVVCAEPITANSDGLQMVLQGNEKRLHQEQNRKTPQRLKQSIPVDKDENCLFYDNFGQMVRMQSPSKSQISLDTAEQTLGLYDPVEDIFISST